MKIIPAAGPLPVESSLNTSNASAVAARERAIARLTNSQPQSATAANPPPAAVVQAQAADNKGSNQGQPDSNVETAPSTPEVPAAAPPAKTEEPISSQYAVLARKEKAYRAKVQTQDAALKAREAAVAEKEAKFSTQPQIDESQYIQKSKLTEDTIQTLLEAGISYDKITEMALQSQNSTVDPQTKALIRQMQDEIKALKADTEGTKKSISQGQEDNYKAAVEQIRKDTQKLVAEGTDFEAIRETDSVSDVVDLIEKTFKEDGVLLTPEEAAQAVEQELVERISKYAKLSKIQQKFKQAYTPAPETSVSTTGDKQPQPPKTLTNGLTNSRQLTARERAILAFENKLNKG